MAIPESIIHWCALHRYTFKQYDAMGAERIPTVGKLFIYIHNKYFIIEKHEEKKTKTKAFVAMIKFQTMLKKIFGNTQQQQQKIQWRRKTQLQAKKKKTKNNMLQ